MPAGSIMVKDFDFLRFGASRMAASRNLETQEGGILQIIKDIRYTLPKLILDSGELILDTVSGFYTVAAGLITVL
jgi:hypothetical protein